MGNKSTCKKICFAITLGEHGGAQRYVLDLATHLPKEQFSVTVALGKEGTWLRNQCKKQNIQVHTLVYTTRTIVNPLRDIISVWELYQFFKKEKFDIVHANSSKIGFTASIAAWLARIDRKSVV